jgi:predicted alpha/beta-hydrolase family hydrolase
MGAMKVDPVSDHATRTLRLAVSTRSSTETVTARVDAPARRPAHQRHRVPGLLLAHGANNDLDHPLLVSVADRVAREGAALVLRFNFPTASAVPLLPTPRPILEAAFRSAYDMLVDTLLEPGSPVFLGGKSLGGRFAAEFVSGAAEGEPLPAHGLVVLGYPLHAPGRQDRLNTRPLEGIRVPSLFCLGTRDPFCEPESLEPILAGLPHPGRLHVVDGADHSFVLPRSSGRGPYDAYDDIGACVTAFIQEIAGTAG